MKRPVYKVVWIFLLAIALVLGSCDALLKIIGPSGPPSTPQGLQLIPGDGMMIVMWSGDSDADSYKVFYQQGPTVNAFQSQMQTFGSPPAYIMGLTNGLQYTFMVSASNSSGESSPSFPMSAIVGNNSGSQAPAAPIGVVVSADAGSATISWPAVAGATSYKLYYIQGNNAFPNTLAKDNYDSRLNGATSPRLVTGLAVNAVFTFAVSASNTNGESDLSAPITVTLSAPSTAPSAPTGISASPGNNEVTISWDTTSGATSYNLYYLSGTSVTKLTGNRIQNVTSPWTIPGLLNGTAYAFIVTAKNSFGESSASITVNATPVAAATAPAAPTGLYTTASDGKVVANWSSVAGATSYNLYYKIDSYTVDPDLDTRIASVTSPYTLLGLQNSHEYAFVVTAVNAVGESQASGVSVATPVAQAAVPTAPIGLYPAPGDGYITLSWDYLATATSYNVYYNVGNTVSTSAGGYIQKIAGIQSSYFTKYNLANGQLYSFVVTASNSVGEGPVSAVTQSSPVAANLPPAAPAWVQATPENLKVTLSWASVPEATSYRVYWAMGANVGYTSAFIDVPSYYSSQTVTNLFNGQPYSFMVTAFNSAGLESSGVYASASPTYVIQAPTEVPYFYAINAGDSQVSLAWYGTGNTSYYQINYSEDPATLSQNSGWVWTTGSTETTIPGLQNGVTYYFIVSAVNQGGIGPWPVGNVYGATPVASQTAPSAPTGLAVSSTTADITLTWNASGGADWYYIYRGTDPGMEYYYSYLYSVPGATTYTYTDSSGLVTGTTYYYKVSAYNSWGESQLSTEASGSLVQTGGIDVVIQ